MTEQKLSWIWLNIAKNSWGGGCYQLFVKYLVVTFGVDRCRPICLNPQNILGFCAHFQVVNLCWLFSNCLNTHTHCNSTFSEVANFLLYLVPHNQSFRDCGGRGCFASWVFSCLCVWHCVIMTKSVDLCDLAVYGFVISAVAYVFQKKIGFQRESPLPGSGN